MKQSNLFIELLLVFGMVLDFALLIQYYFLLRNVRKEMTTIGNETLLKHFKIKESSTKYLLKILLVNLLILIASFYEHIRG